MIVRPMIVMIIISTETHLWMHWAHRNPVTLVL